MCLLLPCSVAASILQPASSLFSSGCQPALFAPVRTAGLMCPSGVGWGWLVGFGAHTRETGGAVTGPMA